MVNSPVLLITFNRPLTTARVFEAIRAAKPPKLYIAADGARPDRPDDIKRCEEVQRIVSNVDWPCDVRSLLRKSNLGCKLSVSSAITWFFENEPEGIILEDDCLPSASFFPYCDELLERYRYDNRVLQISGSNFIGPSVAKDASYFFTYYPDIWGWATWKRAWDSYDLAMDDWPTLSKAAFSRAAHGDQKVDSYWARNFDRTWRGEIDTWDFQWLFMCWKIGGLNIMPSINQIENIGYGGDATHTAHETPKFISPAGLMPFPLVHPDPIEASPTTDKLISRVRYEIHLWGFIQARLRKVPMLRSLLREAKRLFTLRS